VVDDAGGLLFLRHFSGLVQLRMVIIGHSLPVRQVSVVGVEVIVSEANP